MNRQQTLENVEVVFIQKEAALLRLDTAITASAAAKATLENAKAGAANLSGWAEQKNDKSRDTYLRLVCEQEYKAVDDARIEEQEARLQMALVDNQIHMLALIAKINCEWSIERESVDNSELPIPF